MSTTLTPLRYPGGKSQLSSFVIELMQRNNLFYGHYVEAFAGGAGIAWKLLLNDFVTHVHINDLDRAIYAFWHSVLNRTDDFCERIFLTKINVKEWIHQRSVLHASRPTLFDLGFAAFFLNRTNRSGIIDGGVIGGLKQDGDYGIDCRFNKDNLIYKIQRIAACRERISLSRLDAKEFLRTSLRKLPSLSLVNLDPPYYKKGPELYKSHYKAADHLLLSRAVRQIKQYWMVTYDNTPETRGFYAGLPSFTHELYYSAQIKRTGIELLVLDPRLVVPSSLRTQAKAA